MTGIRKLLLTIFIRPAVLAVEIGLASFWPTLIQQAFAACDETCSLFPVKPKSTTRPLTYSCQSRLVPSSYVTAVW